jgi:hypothetical protein
MAERLGGRFKTSYSPSRAVHPLALNYLFPTSHRRMNYKKVEWKSFL